MPFQIPLPLLLLRRAAMPLPVSVNAGCGKAAESCVEVLRAAMKVAMRKTSCAAYERPKIAEAVAKNGMMPELNIVSDVLTDLAKLVRAATEMAAAAVQAMMLSPNQRPCLDGRRDSEARSLVINDRLRLRMCLRRCVNTTTSTTPSDIEETRQIVFVVDDDEDVMTRSWARMAWTATKADVVRTANEPSAVGILDDIAIVDNWDILVLRARLGCR